MGREVVFDDVRRRIDEFGERAALITVTDAGTPHTVSVLVGMRHGRLVAAVGSRSLANLSVRPGVSLLWPAVDGGNYQLIVDGVAEPTAEAPVDGLTEVTIDVTSGILHRLAGLRGAGPTCIAL
jgi:hypothetical protein